MRSFKIWWSSVIKSFICEEKNLKFYSEFNRILNILNFDLSGSLVWFNMLHVTAGSYCMYWQLQTESISRRTRMEQQNQDPNPSTRNRAGSSSGSTGLQVSVEDAKDTRTSVEAPCILRLFCFSIKCGKSVSKVFPGFTSFLWAAHTDVLRLNLCCRLNDLLEENQWADCCGGMFSGSQSSDLRGSGANIHYLCLKSLDYMN